MSKIAAEVVTRVASKKDKSCRFIKYDRGHKDRTQSLQNETLYCSRLEHLHCEMQKQERHQVAEPGTLTKW